MLHKASTRQLEIILFTLSPRQVKSFLLRTVRQLRQDSAAPGVRLGKSAARSHLIGFARRAKLKLYKFECRTEIWHEIKLVWLSFLIVVEIHLILFSCSCHSCEPLQDAGCPCEVSWRIEFVQPLGTFRISVTTLALVAKKEEEAKETSQRHTNTAQRIFMAIVTITTEIRETISQSFYT